MSFQCEKWMTLLTRVPTFICGSLCLWIDCGVSLDCPSLSTPTRRLARVALHCCRVSSAIPSSAPATFITRRRYRLARFPSTCASPPRLPESPFPFCFTLLVIMVRLWPFPAQPEALAGTSRARSVPPVSRARHGGTACVAGRLLREEPWCSVFFPCILWRRRVCSLLPCWACALLLTHARTDVVCGFIERVGLPRAPSHDVSPAAVFPFFQHPSASCPPPRCSLFWILVIHDGGYAHGPSAPGDGGGRVGVVGWRRVVGRIWRSWRDAGGQPGERVWRPVAAVVLGRRAGVESVRWEGGWSFRTCFLSSVFLSLFLSLAAWLCAPEMGRMLVWFSCFVVCRRAPRPCAGVGAVATRLRGQRLGLGRGVPVCDARTSVRTTRVLLGGGGWVGRRILCAPSLCGRCRCRETPPSVFPC